MNQINYAYFVVYRDQHMTTNMFEEFITYRPEIIDWLGWLPNSYFIKSPYTAAQLAAVFRGLFRKNAYFIILDTLTDRNGTMPPPIWEFIKPPIPPPEHRRLGE